MSIEKLLNGSREIKTIKIKNCLCNKLLEQNISFLNNLRQKYRNVKIFYKFPKGRNIIISGLNNEVQKVTLEIENFFDKTCCDIVLKDLEIKGSEFQYLSKQKDQIEKLCEETSSIITLNAIKKYISLKFLNGEVEIELLEGDLTEVCVDAYVNPVNVLLRHNDGLAKVIMDKAGFSVKQDCERFIKENGPLSVGNVFVSKSGDLGVKHNSIIIHAAGPIWKDGVCSESKDLSLVVRNCLNEATNHNCSSIVIPAISTGNFNYPLQDAVKVISEAVVDYILNNSGCLKKIFLISNEEQDVQKWELVLLYIANVFNIKLCFRAKTNQIPNESWYWKDDHGNWKAFASEYNTLIENKFKDYKDSKLSSDKRKFEINISEKKYVIDLANKKQVNLKTNFEHDISNEIPNISKYQWNWIDDSNRKSPFSLIQSEMIEKAFNNNEKSIDFTIKRHDNDNDEIYKFEFAKNNLVVQEYLNKRNNIQADGIQTNKRTRFVRLINVKLW